MLLERLSRKSRARRRAQSDYETLLQSPIHQLLTLLLETALTMPAEAIAFGYRGDETLAKDISVSRIDPATKREVEQFAQKRFGPIAPLVLEARSASPAIIRGPFGGISIPVWAVTSGRYEPWQPIVLHVYFTILHEATNRLVSLNATPNDPQPTKYIELRPQNGKRHLVEVTFEWSLHDQFIIRIHGHQFVPMDAPISTDVF